MFGKVIIFVNIESETRPFLQSEEMAMPHETIIWKRSGQLCASKALLWWIFWATELVKSELSLKLLVPNLRNSISNPLYYFSEKTLSTVLCQSAYPDQAKLAKHYICMSGVCWEVISDSLIKICFESRIRSQPQDLDLDLDRIMTEEDGSTPDSNISLFHVKT